MKKSNLLILIGFLGGLLFIIFIHFTLYMKYKNGDYVMIKDSEFNDRPMQRFENVKHVSMRYVQPAMVRFGEKASVEVRDDVKCVLQGSNLTIYAVDSNDIETREPGSYGLNVTIPFDASIELFRTGAALKLDESSARLNSAITLQHSALMISQVAGKVFHLGNIKIDASDSSAIDLTRIRLDSLDVSMRTSNFNFRDGSFEKLNIVTDSLSQISLPPKQLSRANIQVIPGQ